MSALSHIRSLFMKLSGKTGYAKKNVARSHKWYGNEYGGFYIHPDNLTPDSIVYSFGIGEDTSFDENVLTQHACRVFAFDPTPKSIQWLAGRHIPSGFSFLPFGISDKDGTIDFFLPKNPDHVSGSLALQVNVDQSNRISVPVKRLQTIMQELGHTHIDVLKMDIEGSEYDVITDILVSNLNIDQLLIEFHDRFYENGHKKTKQAIEQLKSIGYEIFAVSASGQEISFIKTN